MKLTHNIRQAFVKAAMQDVPVEDYMSQAHKIAREDAIQQLPKEVRDMASDSKTADYLNMNVYWFSDIGVGSGQMNTVYVHGQRGATPKSSPDAKKKLAELITKHVAQIDMLNKLKAKLTAVAYSCNTSKRLIELLPEFEKYLPPETSKTENLPAIANLVADFSAAGWPKGKPREVEAVKPQPKAKAPAKKAKAKVAA